MKESAQRLRAQRPLLKLLMAKRDMPVATLAADVSASEAKVKGNKMDRHTIVDQYGAVCDARLRLAAHPMPDGMAHDLENLRNLFSSIGLVDWASDELLLAK